MTTKNKEFIEKLTSIKEAVDLAAKDIAKELDFDKAMLTAQSLMPNLIEGSGKNPHFSSDYIKFEQLIAVTRYVLLPLGLRFKQVGHVLEGNDVGIETIICGYGKEESYGIVPIRSAATPHGSAGANTYAKRYSLAMALNISHGKDDDGLSAEIETRQKKMADKAPAVKEKSYNLTSGNTIIASYDSVPDLLEGCREFIGQPKNLNCVAIFDSSKETIQEAIQVCKDSEGKHMKTALEGFTKLMAAYGKGV
tara:strand:+ start:2857 stop:3609 length:753 start_codon:yes stop_codon:yes gene_type:complete